MTITQCTQAYEPGGDLNWAKHFFPAIAHIFGQRPAAKNPKIEKNCIY